MTSLVAMGRRTITGLLCASGQQFQDWSAAYRLFSKERFDIGALFAGVRQAVLERLDGEQPLFVLLDDTLLRKRGRKVSGTSWHRDPLGPKFCNNFIWAQRFLQLSAVLPDGIGPSLARAVPIDMLHCPSPRKPRKKAPEEQWKEYHRLQRESRISLRGADRVSRLRQNLDADGQTHRNLVIAADGSFTNSPMLRNLPERTTFIGRIRKDAKLFSLPAQAKRRGKKPFYGDPAPTPEELRQDESIPWQKTRAFLAGQDVEIEFKAMGPFRWRASGKRDLMLVIIRPLAYRPAKGRKLEYRDPVYLICTDPEFPLPQLVQAYLWRWQIEVGFRDQKTLLGSGEAQVWHASSVDRVPALIAAAYGFLQVAIASLPEGVENAGVLPRASWQNPLPAPRITTQQGINMIRAELWGKALGLENKTDFVAKQRILAKSDLFPSDPTSAILYAAG